MSNISLPQPISYLGNTEWTIRDSSRLNDESTWQYLSCYKKLSIRGGSLFENGKISISKLLLKIMMERLAALEESLISM